MFNHSHSKHALVAVCAIGALVLASCASNKEKGGGPTGTGTPTVSQNASLSALVPAKIKNSKKLIVGINLPYTPNEYLNPSGKVVGFDVDLFDATAKVLGLTTAYRQADFSKIIPAIAAGTYDVGVSSFTGTKEREKTVDFVKYFTAEILWALVGEVLDVMRQLAMDGMTMIVVTHEMGFAREVADQMVFMDAGVVVESGPPRDVLSSPGKTARRRSCRRCCESQMPTAGPAYFYPHAR